MPSSRLLTALCLIAFTSAAPAENVEPFGWDRCVAVYPDEGAEPCIELVLDDCAILLLPDRCRSEHYDNWIAHSVNLAMRSGTQSEPGDNSLRAAEMLEKITGDEYACEDTVCLLSATIREALRFHFAGPGK